MSAAMKMRIERAEFSLVKMSTVRLTDDTRVRLVVPVKTATVFTATIAECLAAKGAR